MDAEQRSQCFVHRVQEIPMVSATLLQALALYDRAKKSTKFTESTLAMAENTVKYAADKIEPVKRMLDGPLVATNIAACRQLEKLEEKYPSIMITPEELAKAGKNYYSTSRVKSGIDTAYSVKDYGVTKVENTKKMASTVVNGVVKGSQMKLVDVLRMSMKVANNALTYSDNLVDVYLPAPGIQETVGTSSDDDSLGISRVKRISTKAVYGLKYKATTTKDRAYELIGQLQSVFTLLEYAKSQGEMAGEETMSKITSAQKQVAATLRRVQKEAGKYGSAELALLNLAKTLSSSFASVSDQLFKYSSPYLSEGVEKNVAYAVQYAHDMNETFAKAKTLSELKDELIVEAGERLTYVREIFVTVLDKVSAYPPFYWMAPALPESATTLLVENANVATNTSVLNSTLDSTFAASGPDDDEFDDEE